MRNKAAFKATLLNLVICALLLITCAVTAAHLQNEIIEEEMRITGRFSKELLETAAYQDAPEEQLVQVLNEGDILFAYFRSDGTVVKNEIGKNVRIPSKIQFSSSKDGIIVNNIRTTDNVKYMVAYAQTESGITVAYAKQSVNWINAIANSVWILIAFVGIAVICQFVVVYRAVSSADTMVDSVMHVLEDFTEGHFDSRIQGVADVPPSVAAKYNSVFARVQDRVFSQQKRNRVFGQMLNQMKNGIITVDTRYNLSFASNSSAELFGVDLTNAEGQPISETFNNEDLEQAFKEAMEQGTGNVITRELEGRRPDTSMRPVRIYASALYREGKCTGALGVIEDITEIRKLEQLRTDFAANVSHEMKTPLTSIKGFVETLQAGAIDNPEMARKFLNIIMIEADRLTRLINDILSITKMESGNESVEIKRIPLDRQVLEVVEMLKIHASEKEVTVSAKQNEKPAFIMGNPDRVKQLLINLIENGIKYNKTGGSVSIKVLEGENNINLIVSDTGIGIKKEHLSRLFERFYRVDKGRSRQMGGTGLGLAIVKHIVNSMGGTVEVHSNYGEGTDFLITLPRAPEEAPAIDNDIEEKGNMED